jgi:hypothetical protein
MCTLFYGDDRLAMLVDDVHRTNRVTVDRLVNEAATWEMSRRRARDVVVDVVGRSPEAVRMAQEEIPGLPSGIPELVLSQQALLRS